MQKYRAQPRHFRIHAVHRFWAPLALAALAVLGLIPDFLLIGALTWLFHIALDRSLGYGLRTHEGYQRP
jgi:putative copper export protein